LSGTVRLPRQIPLKRALELALSGGAIDVGTAQAWGLVNQVVPGARSRRGGPDPGEPHCRQCSAVPPVHTKQMIYSTLAGASDWSASWAGDDPWQLNEEAMAIAFGSHDALEEPRAFADKRTPQREGR
jgi:crotonobetainyl-CoA hydratase